MNEYLTATTKNPESTTAIIMMPDIYGVTDYAKKTAVEFSKTFGQSVYMLDYFYQLSNKPTNITPDKAETAHELMEKMTGEDFVEILQKAVSAIVTDQPRLKSLTVIGFCFAGRLAYLSGTNRAVTKIVSFYGAGAHTPNYYQGQTPIEALTSARTNDPSLQVVSFYGTKDESIPLGDRTKTRDLLLKSGINYQANEYDANHAYFQPGRPNYNQSAAQGSWEVLKQFIK